MNEADDALSKLIRDAGPPPGPDAATLARLRAQAHAEWRVGVERLRRAQRARTWAMAASVVLALAIVLPLALRDGAPAVPVAHLLADAGGRLDGAIERGSRAARALPADAVTTGDELAADGRAVALRLDGSSAALRVDAGSRLRWRGAREIELLAGRVYVDSHDASGTDALTIVVGDARVRHVGTQYLTVREGGSARVLVREGRVHIDLAGGEAEIGRGEVAAFATAGGTIRSGTASLRGADWAWAEAIAPRVPLEGRDLRGVLFELARETGRPLRFATAEAEAQALETILHGPALDVPPGDALRTLLATSGFVATTDSTSEIVVASRQ